MSKSIEDHAILILQIFSQSANLPVLFGSNLHMHDLQPVSILYPGPANL